MDALAGLSAGIGGEDEDFRAARAGSKDHAFGGAELAHFACGEVGADDDEAVDEAVGGVGILDAGEDGTPAEVAEVDGELHELVGFFDRLGGEDAGDAEVDGGEAGRRCRWAPAAPRRDACRGERVENSEFGIRNSEFGVLWRQGLPRVELWSGRRLERARPGLP